MKKIILISLLCVVMMFSACTEGSTEETEVTEWVPSSSTAEAKKPKAGAIDVQEEQVKLENAEETQVATKKPHKAKKATEETEETTEEIPTQGVVNPKGHIPVTTAMGSFSKADTDFIYMDSTIVLNDKIENIFEDIGEDNSCQEVSDTEMSYDYFDFILYTYIDSKGDERLNKIVIPEEDVPTSKGVKIGSYATDLVEIYGNPKKQESGVKYYISGSNRLAFKYKNNLITEIVYEYSPE